MTSAVLRGKITGALGAVRGGRDSLTIHCVGLGVITLFTVH